MLSEGSRRSVLYRNGIERSEFERSGHDGQPRGETYRHQRVQRDEETPLPEFVRAEGDCEGVESARDVWRGGEEQTELVGVALAAENDGQEVGESITLEPTVSPETRMLFRPDSRAG